MNLRRIRWGCRAVLGVGVAASIVGNVLHARDNPISQAISAWPPIALLLTIELISRVPVHGRRLSATRIAACAVVASIAAWVSYWHMAAVASNYGETGASPYLLPLSVDGFVVVAWICLAELAGRIRAADEEGERDGTVRQGPEVSEAQEASGLGLQGTGGSERPQGEGGGEGAGRPDRQEEEVAAATRVNLTRPRKRPPSSADRVVRAHNRTPDASHAELAKRLNLTVPTVKRHRPARPNGSVPDLEVVDA